MLQRLVVLCLLAFVASSAYAQTDLGSVRATFNNAVAKVMPAVVSIYTQTRVAQPVGNMVAYDPLMQQLMGVPLVRKKLEQGLGSGVIVGTDGTLVTNLHVIEGAEAVVAVLADGREFPVQFINADKRLDLAVLKLVLPNNEKLPVARFGNSRSLKVGDVVLALGNPYGLGQSASMGVVSAVERTNKNLSQYGQFIQTDATINPGNSGGALIDSTGAVVGINTAIFTRSGGSQGIGFAVPAHLVEAVVRGITTTGQVVRPWLGITSKNLTAAAKKAMNITHGVRVEAVAKNSPAAAAGVKVADIITAFNSQTITDQASLADSVLAAANALGQTRVLSVVRAGQVLNINLDIQALPARKAADKLTIGGRHALSGYTLEELSPALTEELGLPEEVEGLAVVGVPAQSMQQVFGVALQVGDVLQSINKKTLSTLADVDAALGSGFTRGTTLRFWRAGRVFTVVTTQ
jgi:S1-C subfamily serine protease